MRTTLPRTVNILAKDAQNATHGGSVKERHWRIEDVPDRMMVQVDGDIV